MIQPQCLLHNPINSVTTRFVRASTNKVRCPVFTVAVCIFLLTYTYKSVVTISMVLIKLFKSY